MSIISKFNPKLGPPPLHPRDRILAAWRGMNLTEAEGSHTSAAKPVDRIMPAVLKRLGLNQRQAETEILNAWGHLMDPNITAHARPAGLAKGTLFVSVDSSVWLAEIVRYRRREILERLQHCFGRETIKKISFRAG